MGHTVNISKGEVSIIIHRNHMWNEMIQGVNKLLYDSSFFYLYKDPLLPKMWCHLSAHFPNTTSIVKAAETMYVT